MPFISDIAIDTELINGSFTLTNGIGGGVVTNCNVVRTTIASKKAKK
jgi:hypothetical protein